MPPVRDLPALSTTAIILRSRTIAAMTQRDSIVVETDEHSGPFAVGADSAAKALVVVRSRQIGPQVFQARPDPGFDRGKTDTETLRHLGIAESGVVRERDGFVLECGQLGEAAAQGIPFVVSHCRLGHHIGRGLIVATAPRVVVVHGGAFVPDPVHGLAMGQHPQPGEHGTAALVELDRTAPHLDVDVVTGLFGVPAIADDRKHAPVDQTAGAAIELRERLLIAVTDAMYQFGIDSGRFDINRVTKRSRKGPRCGWNSSSPMRNAFGPR